MPIYIFLATAAGPNFGPANIGDRASLTTQTAADLNNGPFGPVVMLDPSQSDAPTDVGGTE